MIEDFLTHIPDAASSPLAFVSYGLVVAAWVIRTWLLTNPRRNAQKILAQFSDDKKRLSALAEVFNEQPPSGLVGNDAILIWVNIKSREKTQVLLVVAWIATAVAVLLFLIAVHNSANAAKLIDPASVPKWQSHFDDPSYEPLSVSWDGPAHVVGDLVVPAGSAEYFKNPKFSPLSNFTADFEFRLTGNQKSAGWLVRANKATQSYYQFTLNLEAQPPRVEGTIVRRGRVDGKLNFSNVDPTLPLLRFEGEVLMVHLVATGCNFDHEFRIRPPTPNQSRVLSPELLTLLVGDNNSIAARPFPLQFSAGTTCADAGQFGFLSPDSDETISSVRIRMAAN